MVGIYKITNQITGDFYIGKSKNIKKRLYNHKHYVRHSEKFETDIERYGWENFTFEVIEECGEDELLEREAFHIRSLKPSYNTIIRGRKRPADVRKRISISLTGKKQSPNVIEKRKASIRKLRETVPQTNAGHRKRVLVSMNGRSVEFESVKAVAEFMNVHPSTVTKALKRGGKVRGHLVWYAV